jgi:D-alanyl-D-alanine dipeptidase
MPPTSSARPWHLIPIQECGEPLLDLPKGLLRLEPHPYQILGAPYGPGVSPFRLRRGVIARLAAADARLAEQRPGWRLAIFDAWRPVAVQEFMVSHAIGEECRLRGLDPSRDGPEQEEVVREVGRFWAPPSLDPTTPPPHSTGAAVDLTLADGDGPLEMGGAIDTVGSVSEPDHHRARAEADCHSPEAIWHGRRQQLAAVMGWAGFAQHPNEWWHFSWGDQLWAWRQGEPQARYGRVEEVD